MKAKPFALAFWTALGVGVALGAMRLVGNLDLWFQLLAGRYALDKGALPRTEFFLYFYPEAPQQFGGWGFGAIYELSIRAMGFGGATLLNMAIWGLAFAFAARAALLRSGQPARSVSSFQALGLVCALSLAFGAVSYRMGMRAESTLFLAWMFSLWLFEASKAKGKVWIFQILLPLVGWAEAMLHTGGFLLLAIVPICALRDPPSSWGDMSWWTRWAACALGLALLPIANPNGLSQVYIQAISALQGIANTTHDWQLRTMIGGQETVLVLSPWEYRPLWDPRAARLRPAFALAAIACVLACSRKPWRHGWFESLVFVAFLIQALAVSRALAFVAMAVLIPAMEAGLALGGRYARGVNAKLVGVVALAMCAAPALFGVVDGGWGMSGGKPPEAGLIEKIKELRPDGARIFAKENGPGLAYALGEDKYKVAYGAHYLTFNQRAQEHYLSVLHALPGWEGELTKERVDLVCVPPYMSFPKEGEFFWLPSMLVNKPEWRMWIVGDSTCLLFEKLSDAKKLSEAGVASQTVEYLSLLRQYKDLASGGEPDLVARGMGELSMKKLRSIKLDIEAGQGPRLHELSNAAQGILGQLDAERAPSDGTKSELAAPKR